MFSSQIPEKADQPQPATAGFDLDTLRLTTRQWGWMNDATTRPHTHAHTHPPPRFFPSFLPLLNEQHSLSLSMRLQSCWKFTNAVHDLYRFWAQWLDIFCSHCQIFGGRPAQGTQCADKTISRDVYLIIILPENWSNRLLTTAGSEIGLRLSEVSGQVPRRLHEDGKHAKEECLRQTPRQSCRAFSIIQ